MQNDNVAKKTENEGRLILMMNETTIIWVLSNPGSEKLQLLHAGSLVHKEQYVLNSIDFPSSFFS